ncbi:MULTISPECIES: hypothetical protein [unclassified Pseudoalteromonas]|uniref:hypothetical protein n=1 Tax=unclassified Pseudoalteromonas TaxID=194690 RepID=UPI001F10CBC1
MKRLLFCLLMFATGAPVAAEKNYQAVFASLKKMQQQLQQLKASERESADSQATATDLNKKMNGEGIPVGELLFFSAYLKHTYLGEVLAVKSQQGIWVDLLSFSETVEFVIDVNGNTGIAKGWFINPENTFVLDTTKMTITVKGRTFSIAQEQLHVDQQDIFVASTLLEQVFDLTMAVDYSTLELYINSDARLPIEARLARQKRELSQTARYSEPTLPWKESPYQAVSSPMADIQISMTADDQQSSAGYSILGANDLAYLNAEYYFAGRDGDLLTDSRLTFSREDLNSELLGPLAANRIEFGDVLATQIGNRFNSNYARGAKVTNKPLFKPVNTNQVNIIGNIQPGWDVELYQNGVLINQLLSLNDGRYIFENVDLLYGANNFELIFYGPQGQVERKTEQYLIDGTSLSAGESFYEFSITEQGHQLFNQSNYYVENPGWLFSGRYDTALTDNISVYGGIAGLKSEYKDDTQNLAIGSNVSLFDRLLINLDYEQNNEDESELEFTARGQIAEQALRFRASERERLINRQSSQQRMSSSSNYEFNISGEVFQNQYGRLNYQNNAYYTDIDSRYDSLKLENIMNYAYSGFSFNHRLSWQKDSRLDDSTLLGNVRLQGRFGQVFSRFSLDYSMSPHHSIQSYEAQFNRSLTSQLQGELTLRNSLIDDVKSAEIGLNWQSDRFSLNSNLNYDSEDRWRVGLFSRFSLGYASQGTGIFSSKRSLARSGTLMAHVYLDANNNGIKDESEHGIAGVKVKGVQNYRQAVTDENGIALLTSMPANRTTDIVIDPDSFPDPFLVAANDGFSVTPRAGFIEYIDIALNNSSEVEGVVYVAQDENMKVQPFANISLIDKTGKKVSQTQAAYDGYYLFTDLRPGEYKAVIDDEYKDKKSLKDNQHVTLNLSAGGEVVVGADLVLKPKQVKDGYIAKLGQFSSLAILKTYLYLVKKPLSDLAILDPFYIKKSDKEFVLSAAFSETQSDELTQVCSVLKSYKLNCDVEPYTVSY